ncbi:MAG: response regulator [Bacteroidota bacterium]
MTTTTSTCRILIVDDEPHIVTAIDFLMQQCGFETAHANDGLEALHKVAQFRPDLIILDVSMPRMDGFELSKEIRTRLEYQNTKIIFLTAKGTQKDKMDGYGAGGDVYLTKPFDNRELVKTVTEMVQFECQ